MRTPRRPRARAALLAAGAAVVVSATGCAGAPPPGSSSTSAESPGAAAWRPHALPATGDPACSTVVVAAGDIVDDVGSAERTGRLARAQDPDLVLVLGDNQYSSGALADYRAEYDRTPWGSLRPITNPVPGNHEYLTPDAAGYFTYFGGPPSYYAYDAGCGWRGYALNSETDIPEQADWLRRDLAVHPGAPVLASWHRPRLSSGTEHGDEPAVQPFWDAIGERRGIVLNGHEHDYERFAPVRQVREFVVGTGGSSGYPFGTPAPGSQARVANTPGVLRLELLPEAYRWSFLTTTGAVRDSGRG